jgi:hypothetical protein
MFSFFANCWARWWRPKPKFQIGEEVVIKAKASENAPNRIPRYSIMRARRWIRSERCWAYDVPVKVIRIDPDGVPKLHITYYARNVSEDQFSKMAGGTFGLQE